MTVYQTTVRARSHCEGNTLCRLVSQKDVTLTLTLCTVYSVMNRCFAEASEVACLGVHAHVNPTAVVQLHTESGVVWYHYALYWDPEST